MSLVSTTNVSIYGNEFIGQRFIGDAHRLLAILRSDMRANGLNIGRRVIRVGDPGTEGATIVGTSIHGQHTAVIYTELPKKEITVLPETELEGSGTFIVIVEDKDANKKYHLWLVFDEKKRSDDSPVLKYRDLTVYQTDGLTAATVAPFSDFTYTKLTVRDKRITPTVLEPNKDLVTRIVNFETGLPDTVKVYSEFTEIKELLYCTNYFLTKDETTGESTLYTWWIMPNGNSPDYICLIKYSISVNLSGSLTFTMIGAKGVNPPEVAGSGHVNIRGGVWWPRCIRYITKDKVAFNYYRMYQWSTTSEVFPWYHFAPAVIEFDLDTLEYELLTFTHESEFDAEEAADSIKMGVWNPFGYHTVAKSTGGTNVVKNIEIPKRNYYSIEVPSGEVYPCYTEDEECHWPNNFNHKKTDIEIYREENITNPVETTTRLQEYRTPTPSLRGHENIAKYYPRFMLLVGLGYAYYTNYGQGGRGPSGDGTTTTDKIDLPWYYPSDWAAPTNLDFVWNIFNATSDGVVWWYTWNDIHSTGYEEHPGLDRTGNLLKTYKLPDTGDSILHITPVLGFNPSTLREDHTAWITICDGSINDGIAIGTDIIATVPATDIDWVDFHEKETHFYGLDARVGEGSDANSILHYFMHVDPSVRSGWSYCNDIVRAYAIYKRRDRLPDIYEAVGQYIHKYINDSIADSDWRIIGMTLR